MESNVNVVAPEATQNVAANATNANTGVKFMTITAFKQEIGVAQLSVVKNPNTGKLFVNASNGVNYKCQADIDTSLPMSILIPATGIADACLVNTKNTDNTLAVL